MKTKEITLCGQQVKVAYCAASENGFEDISGKSINDLDFTKNKDMLMLSAACIIAPYAENGEESPIEMKQLLYEATPNEITELYLTVINLRNEWYGIPKVVADNIKKENEHLTEEERKEAEKNAPAPTTDTASS